MFVPSKKPVRRRMALRCIRRSLFRDVLGDGPTKDCPDANSFASCTGHAHCEEYGEALTLLPCESKIAYCSIFLSIKKIV